VQNTGDASLVFTPAVAVNAGTGWLSVSPSTQQTVAAGGSVTMTVTTTNNPAGGPLTVGTRTGSITVSDANAANGSDAVAIELSTTAAPGTMCVTPTSLDLGDVKRSTTKPSPAVDNVTLMNVGDGAFAAGWSSAVTMNTASNGTTSAGTVTLNPASQTEQLAAGGSVPIKLTVTANAPANRNGHTMNATVTFTSTGTAGSGTTVTVTWTQVP
jgi:hypothetical protein